MTDGAGVKGLMLAGSSLPFRGEAHKVGLLSSRDVKSNFDLILLRAVDLGVRTEDVLGDSRRLNLLMVGALEPGWSKTIVPGTRRESVVGDEMG